MGFRDNLARFMTWSEPGFVKRAERGIRLIPLWYHFIALGLCGLMIYIGLFVRPPSTGDPPWTPYVVGLGMALVSYLIPIMNGASGAMVTFDKHGVTRWDHPVIFHVPILMILKVGVYELKWERVHSVLLVERGEIAGRPVRLLELYGEGDTLITRVGLPEKKPTVEKLRECLAKNGKELAVVGEGS